MSILCFFFNNYLNIQISNKQLFTWLQKIQNNKHQIYHKILITLLIFNSACKMLSVGRRILYRIVNPRIVHDKYTIKSDSSLPLVTSISII